MIAGIVSGLLFAILQVERAIHTMTTVELLYSVFYTLFGLAIVVFLICVVFNGFFENSLQPVWAAQLNNRWRVVLHL